MWADSGRPESQRAGAAGQPLLHQPLLGQFYPGSLFDKRRQVAPDMGYCRFGVKGQPVEVRSQEAEVKTKIGVAQMITSLA